MITWGEFWDKFVIVFLAILFLALAIGFIVFVIWINVVLLPLSLWWLLLVVPVDIGVLAAVVAFVSGDNWF